MKKGKCDFEKFPTRTIPGGEPRSSLMVLDLGEQSSGIVKTPVTDMQKHELKLVNLQRRLVG